MKLTNTLLSIFALCALIAIIWYFMSSSKEQQRFDGYIVWQRESVIFVKGLNFPEGVKYEIVGEPIWVEQNNVLDQIYDYSVKLDSSEHPDSPRAIKASFYGFLDKDGDVGIGFDESTMSVTISEVIKYSTDL